MVEVNKKLIIDCITTRLMNSLSFLALENDKWPDRRWENGCMLLYRERAVVMSHNSVMK